MPAAFHAAVILAVLRRRGLNGICGGELFLEVMPIGFDGRIRNGALANRLLGSRVDA
jgi:hypothetical protein